LERMLPHETGSQPALFTVLLGRMKILLNNVSTPETILISWSNHSSWSFRRYDHPGTVGTSPTSLTDESRTSRDGRMNCIPSSYPSLSFL
jgi:hypothetical protein